MNSIITLACLFGTYLCGYMYSRDSFKERAIKEGVAKYVVNTTTGKKRFVFIPNRTTIMSIELELLMDGSITKERVKENIAYWRNEHNSAND